MGNRDADASSLQGLPKLPAAVTSVCNDTFGATLGLASSRASDPTAVQECLSNCGFMLLTGRQDETERLAFSVGAQMDLGRPSSTTAP